MIVGVNNRAARDRARTFPIHHFEVRPLWCRKFLKRQPAIAIPINPMKHFSGVFPEVRLMKRQKLVLSHGLCAVGRGRKTAAKNAVELGMRDLSVVIGVEIGKQSVSEAIAVHQPLHRTVRRRRAIHLG